MRRLAIALSTIALVLASGCDSCGRTKKTSPRVFPIQGESKVLPRIQRDVRANVSLVASKVETIQVGARTRKYVLVRPNAIVEGVKLALVLVFHGDGGDAIGFHQAFPFERASGAEAVLAYPDSADRRWDLETKDGNEDVAFVETLVDALAQHYPIDTSRVFLTGYSSGGFFANVFACQRSDRVRAIASNAGGAPYKQAETWPNGFPKCPGEKPVAALALHGTSDMGVTLDSGRFSAEYWAYVNGCKTEDEETTGYPECVAYRGCKPGKDVGWCEVPDLGHWVWDRAAEASWTFFQIESSQAAR